MKLLDMANKLIKIKAPSLRAKTAITKEAITNPVQVEGSVCKPCVATGLNPITKAVCEFCNGTPEK